MKFHIFCTGDFLEPPPDALRLSVNMGVTTSIFSDFGPKRLDWSFWLRFPWLEKSVLHPLKWFVNKLRLLFSEIHQIYEAYHLRWRWRTHADARVMPGRWDDMKTATGWRNPRKLVDYRLWVLQRWCPSAISWRLGLFKMLVCLSNFLKIRNTNRLILAGDVCWFFSGFSLKSQIPEDFPPLHATKTRCMAALRARACWSSHWREIMDFRMKKSNDGHFFNGEGWMGPRRGHFQMIFNMKPLAIFGGGQHQSSCKKTEGKHVAVALSRNFCCEALPLLSNGQQLCLQDRTEIWSYSMTCVAHSLDLMAGAALKAPAVYMLAFDLHVG